MHTDPDGRDGTPEQLAALVIACTQPGTLRTLFQPIVDLQRGRVAGYEALTRIELEPRLGPDRWFAAAHAAGLGPRLEAAAVRNALRARSELPGNCFLTVNVAPEALLSDELQCAFAAAGDLRGVIVELTEQTPVDDYDALLAAFAPLREVGALLAVDDAGAGYASLTHITRLRPQLIKIDRTHVAGIDHDPARVAVVQTLGELGSRLDAWVLAEGVETRAELETVIDLGVPLAQGWFLGRPSPAMAPALPQLQVAHGERARRVAAGALGELLERAVCIAHDAPASLVAQTFASEPAARVLVLVDEHQRPLDLIHRSSGRNGGGVLTVDLATSLPQLVQRLVHRDERVRFDPVVACDEQGAVVGLLTLERLLLALAAEPA
ncbi:EAL domain-containing protein [Conexibacter sp. JD483]|uniref:EAL domain-containing protein n=1 Tax=unclassified Conexibacter TaxID=2627773 RepID=UPI0027237D5D|nr:MULTISPECIES: EAL domain-containing protein [unclassified Conexibacter]MDO8186949.1 EAL domain-containing protein [Conexibacter sp. CPCC 205706]MDO8200596.1 EAL domain-containing protein [Conexibacter sp. CPCC 205762]MDR9368826.1 EAL domain-containing protein [Conexibacter sp. JD483]